MTPAELTPEFIASVKNEIYDGATPHSTYVRRVIVDGERGVPVIDRDGSALMVEG